MQQLLVCADSSTSLFYPLPHHFGVKAEVMPTTIGKRPPAATIRAGAYTADMVRAENLYQTFKGVKADLPGGYNIMDATSRLSVIANNTLRVAQAWGWDITVNDHRFFQPSQHKWETTARDFGNNALSNSLISMVKGDYLSNLFLDGFVKASYTAEPETYMKDDSFGQRSAKIWHNTVRYPFRKQFGLSAHPLTTIGHVLPPKERSWLDIKPLDTNILRLKHFGDTLSLKTTFDAIQEVILTIEDPSKLLDNLRKAGTRQELKKLMVSLEPEKTVKPQVMTALESLFDEKTGNLKKDAHQMAPKVEEQLRYFLELYQPCGGYGTTNAGIKALFKQVLAAEECPIIGNDGLPAMLSAQHRAMQRANKWFKGINTNWKTEANNAVRTTTLTLFEHISTFYNKEVEQSGPLGKTYLSRQAFARKLALEVAPKLISKTGNTYSGELASILEPAFQLSKRTALLNEYEAHRSSALLAQTLTQGLFTCFVLGNLLFFVVFNTLARLDVDFKGPHGETRLDFGEMKRSFKRWLKKQLGQEVEEPATRTLTPKVSLALSLGQNMTLRREQQLLNSFKPVAPLASPVATPVVMEETANIPVSTSAFFLKQTINSFQQQEECQPLATVERALQQ